MNTARHHTPDRCAQYFVEKSKKINIGGNKNGL